ncbi:ATP-binding cassette domain-containing protein [Lactococcus protaetiae]|uniref:ABC transporter ATP-binding protein n=1 Tax=Lactococcus protaetiae TaxID=2592653 RepID=A0A514Z7M9_9LACT|nr:ABC transporter ATP-binding protein [Lactococcus protaetiae]QDK70601.1 ABC transporter ATP-binding protein [Lactococcus protaetiae]
MKITNLAIKFGDKEVLQSINLQVNKGERIAILGQNGSGKTTLLNLINKTLVPTAGKIEDEDFEINNQNRCYIIQHENLPSELKIKEALHVLAQSPENFEKGLGLAEHFDLTKALDKRFSKLSGGEKQKLFLISAMQNNPEYFFLDEITTGLDYNSRDELLSFLSEVFEESRATLFLVTHYIEEALRLCNRFVVVANGRITQDFTRDELVQTNFSLVQFDRLQVDLTEELIDEKTWTYKISKDKIPDILGTRYEEIIKYKRDFVRNLGEIISD